VNVFVAQVEGPIVHAAFGLSTPCSSDDGVCVYVCVSVCKCVSLVLRFCVDNVCMEVF